MEDGRQLRFWLVGILLLVALFYIFRGILLPFVAGMAVAYLLDPLADRLEVMGIRRSAGAAVIIAGFFAFLILLGVLLYPVIARQFVEFTDRLPSYVSQTREFVMPFLDRLLVGIVGEEAVRLRDSMTSGSEWVLSRLDYFLSQIWSGGLAIFNLLSLVLITPVVAFFLLRDWDLIVARIDGWLPKDYEATIRAQARLVDSALAGFVRGQAMVCLTLATLYAIGWTAVGLDFGLVLGLVTGLLAFVPYAGAFLGLVLASIIGAAQFLPDIASFSLVVVVFAVIQSLDATIITPRLMGSNVGLHPVWILFALLAGASVLGFLGVLVAVPVAAVVGVLVRFGLSQYLASAYYLGTDAYYLGTEVREPESPGDSP